MKPVKLFLPHDLILHLKKQALEQGVTLSELARKILELRHSNQDSLQESRPKIKIPKKEISTEKIPQIENQSEGKDPVEFWKKQSTIYQRAHADRNPL